MIVIDIGAGLGNQMFMYAFGRALTLENSEQLYLNISPLKFDKLRSYGLKHLSIPKEVKILDSYSKYSLPVKLKKTFFRVLFKLFGEDNENIDVSLKYAPYGYFISKNRGYVEAKYYNRKINIYSSAFQSVKYFEKYSDIIKSELKVSASISDECKKMKYRISTTNSVCVHIRRGDYLKSPIHNLCGDDYYKRAISLIKEKVDEPIFYIFSDDIQWVKEHYYGKEFVAVDVSKTDYEDLFLMYHCKNFIIPNSTFSWWGQYLCNNKEKIVIAPERWYKGLPKKVTDIYIDSWIQLNV